MSRVAVIGLIGLAVGLQGAAPRPASLPEALQAFHEASQLVQRGDCVQAGERIRALASIESNMGAYNYQASRDPRLTSASAAFYTNYSAKCAAKQTALAAEATPALATPRANAQGAQPLAAASTARRSPNQQTAQQPSSSTDAERLAGEVQKAANNGDCDRSNAMFTELKTKYHDKGDPLLDERILQVGDADNTCRARKTQVGLPPSARAPLNAQNAQPAAPQRVPNQQPASQQPSPAASQAQQRCDAWVKVTEWFMKDAPRAEAECRRAIKDHASPHGYVALARALVIQQKFTDAAKVYLLAANQGDAKAQTKLGEAYENGHYGVEKDDAQAISWYRKAIAQGDHEAEGRLGFMYETGSGLAKDKDQAVMWYRRAAEGGDELGMGRLAGFGNGGPVVDAATQSYWNKRYEEVAGFHASQIRENEAGEQRKTLLDSESNESAIAKKPSAPVQKQATAAENRVALDCRYKGDNSRGSVIIDLANKRLIEARLETIRADLPLSVTSTEITWRADDGTTYTIERATVEVHVKMASLVELFGNDFYYVWFCKKKEGL